MKKQSLPHRADNLSTRQETGGDRQVGSKETEVILTRMIGSGLRTLAASPLTKCSVGIMAKETFEEGSEGQRGFKCRSSLLSSRKGK